MKRGKSENTQEEGREGEEKIRLNRNKQIWREREGQKAKRKIVFKRYNDSYRLRRIRMQFIEFKESFSVDFGPVES